MTYLALIGDFIRSKEMADRLEVQDKLQQKLDGLNTKYASFLVSKLTITLGDEFQGLFSVNAPIFQIVDELALLMSPHAIRFGLGVGEILTDIDSERSIGADGPAYWRARQAIEMVHAKNDYGSTKIALVLENQEWTKQANALLSASEHIKTDWRASQKAVFEALLQLDIYQEQFEQHRVAAHLGLRESAFTKRLKSSGVKIYFRCRMAVQDVIARSGEDNG